jgi:hypothetical protein
MMFIVLLEGPGLLVFKTSSDAVQAIEPPDAEVEIRAAFDADAVPYLVEWLTPNRHTASATLFGSVPAVEFGEYRFVPAGPADADALIALLEEHPDAEPPEAKPELDALLERMRTQRDSSRDVVDVD